MRARTGNNRCMNETILTGEAVASLLARDRDLPVVLCIGTDRVIGDALGPLVGEALTRVHNAPFFVYGTLSLPVTALTLPSALTVIKRRHAGKTLIAVDSSLGRAADIGKIRLGRGGIKPGLASGKDLPLTGDIHVTATVAALNDKRSLSSVRLGFVSRMAGEIAAALYEGIVAFSGTLSPDNRTAL